MEKMDIHQGYVVSLDSKETTMKALPIAQLLDKYPKAKKLWTQKQILQFYSSKLLDGKPSEKDPKMIEIYEESLIDLLKYIERSRSLKD